MVKLRRRRQETRDRSTEEGTTEGRTPADTSTDEPAVTTADSPESTAVVPDRERSSVMRVPAFSLLAPVLGWLLAWGVIATATSALDRSGVELGFNLGIADGGVGADGFVAGFWLLLVSCGAFIAGGYAAARMARANGTAHAVLMWVVAMVATAADAIIETVRDGTEGVIQLIGGVPFWAESGMTDGYERTVVFGIFAAAQLAGSLVGGGLGQIANRVERSDDVVVVDPSADRAGTLREPDDQVVQPELSDDAAARQEPSDEEIVDEEIVDEEPPANGSLPPPGPADSRPRPHDVT